MGQPPFLGGVLGTLWSSVFWVAHAIAIIAAACFVYRSAVRRTQAAMGIGALWWVLFTLVGGIWTLFVYWIMEHSTLSTRRSPDDR
jgi:hypothetical protein